LPSDCALAAGAANIIERENNNRKQYLKAMSLSPEEKNLRASHWMRPRVKINWMWRKVKPAGLWKNLT
jgi:hypothetical protein